MKLLDVVFVYHLAGHERVAWHGRYHSHGCNQYELHFFLEGGGTFLIGSLRHRIVRESLFLTAPGEFHSIIPDPIGQPITYYALLFEAGGKEDAELVRLLDDLWAKNGAGRMRSFQRFKFEEISEMFKSNAALLKKAAEYTLLSLMYKLYHQNAFFYISGDDTNTEAGGKPKTTHAHVNKALTVMQTNVRKNLPVDELARILALSTEHFIRLFRAEVKLTPHQYMLRLKIEGASGLLISTSKNVGQIADWFGFENQFHFSRCFKKCTGVSPLEYRKTFLQAVDFKPVP
jgi:AraC-like DNA-binding protein